jgi:hypothetical protein
LNICQTYAAQQSVTKFVETNVMKLVAPKAAGKHKLLFNKPDLIQSVRII